MTHNEPDIQWGAVAFLFVLLALLFVFIFTVGLGEKAGGAGKPGQAKPGHGDAAAAGEEFWARVSEHAPDYAEADYTCPVDGTQFKVPTQLDDNRFGGVASDLMKIAVAPAPGGKGYPDLAQQDYLKLCGSCPSCGFSAMQIDLSNFGKLPAAAEQIKQWRLADALPGLADVPPAQWTADERLFVRYLGLKQAGFPAGELGYYALNCAYASNFDTWYGRDCGASGAAYYALAAAQLRAELAHGEFFGAAERPIAAMTLGELYRLLGRPADAAEWYGQAAQAPDALGPGAKVLAQLQGFLVDGNFMLMRVEIEELQQPPVGWYLETMLPAINGELAVRRGEWNTGDDPLEFERRIAGVIEQRRGGK